VLFGVSTVEFSVLCKYTLWMHSALVDGVEGSWSKVASAMWKTTLTLERCRTWGHSLCSNRVGAA
jgi:hypothetical protein